MNPWIPALAALFCGALAPAPERAPLPAPDHFPRPSRALSIPAPSAEGPKLLWLVEELAAIGGVELVASQECRKMLAVRDVGLFRAVLVPPAEAWSFAGALLWTHGFALTERRQDEPRLVQVVSLDTNERNHVRSGALMVPESTAASFARHPALIVSTLVEMPHTDVRTLSNSLRALLTDANTQQLVPAGTGNTLLVTANGSTLANLVELLRRIEAENAASPPRRAEVPKAPESSER